MKSAYYHFNNPAELLSSKIAADCSCQLLLQVYLCDDIAAWQLPLQVFLAKHFPNATVVGITSYGQFAGASVQNSGLSLHLTSFKQVQLATHYIAAADSDLEKQVAINALIQPSTKVIILFSTNLLDNHQDLLPLLNQLRPDIVVVGAIAVPKGDMFTAHLLQQSCWHSNGTLLLALSSEHLAAKAIVKQNWFAIGKPFTITQASQFVVNTIAGITVKQLYQRYLGPQAGQHLAAASSIFPLIFDDGVHQISAFVVKALPDGSAIFNRPLQTGQQVRLSFAEINNVLNNDYLAAYEDLPAEQVMVFSCGARVELLKDTIVQELAPLQQKVPCAGCFAFGEIVTLQPGKSNLQSHSMVSLFMAETPATIHFECIKESIVDRYGFDLTNNELLRIYSNVTRAIMADLTAMNDALLKQSQHDHLTGLASRSYLDQELMRAHESFIRYQHVYSVLLLDIDYFKKINDSYGHLNGDKVLKATADNIKQTLRSNDLVGRWGGEEFLVLCPATPLEAAKTLAERIRKVVSMLSINSTEGAIRLTVSIGVATITTGMNIDDVLKQADANLYKAKAEGRNRVI